MTMAELWKILKVDTLLLDIKETGKRRYLNLVVYENRKYLDQNMNRTVYEVSVYNDAFIPEGVLHVTLY